MNENAKALVEVFARVLPLPDTIIELGSLQVDVESQRGFADLRPLFPGKTYIGCDLTAGPGVDRIENAERLSFPDASIGMLIAIDCLEHIADPARAIAEIHRVLAPGGTLLLTSPFLFPIHHDPDYTRFTPEGLSRLLRPFDACAVFSIGDAHWPNSVFAIAQRGAEPSETGRGFEEVVALGREHWDGDSRRDPLLRFAPVTSLLRRDGGPGPARELDERAGVQHEFLCTENGLCRLDLKVVRSRGKTPHSLTLELVRTDAGAQPIRAHARTGLHWTERWVRFAFPPLGDSAQQQFRLRLTATHSAEHAIAAAILDDGGPCIEAFRERGALAVAPQMVRPTAASGESELSELRRERAIAEESCRLLRERIGALEERIRALEGYPSVAGNSPPRASALTRWGRTLWQQIRR